MELEDALDRVLTGPSPVGPQKEPTPGYAPGAVEELIGKRVQIRAIKAQGSARLLDGLIGTVVAPHPIARGWVKLDLDENARTPHRDWSVAIDRLVLVAPEFREEGGPGLE